MNPNQDDNELENVYEQLNEEAAQEELTSDAETSFLASIDPEIHREREREYRDPEKHWVRREVWLKTLRDLSKEKKRGLRYLTLPSFYRLDVSLFLRENLLEFIKTDAGVSTNAVYVAAFELDPTKYGRMVGQSPPFILFGRGAIEDAIVDASNEYFEQLASLFPFDVVNLDLTTSLTPRHEGPYSKTMQAIDTVLRRQADCAGRWALFLTVRNVPNDWEKRALKQFFENLQSNLTTYPKAQQVFFERYQETDVVGLKNKDTKMCISQSVAKWLTDRANSYGVRLETMNCYRYDRYSEVYDPYTIAKYVLVFSKGPILSARVPMKAIPRQSWMDDDVVTCIKKHKLIDVQDKLLRLNENVPSIFDDLEKDIQELCDMLN